MTRIIYDPVTLTLSAEGHAGYAERGRDIVCAGISALLFALPAALEREHIPYRLDRDTGQGCLRIRARPTISCRYICLVILATIIEGLRNIRNEYPESISITIRESEDE